MLYWYCQALILPRASSIDSNAEAEQIGATADLRALIDTGLDAARDIYRTYWP